MSAEQFAARQGQAFSKPKAEKKKNKYNATRVYYDRMWFDSIGERERYAILRIRERAASIRDLVVHPSFPLHVDGKLIGTFRPDFRYLERSIETAGVWCEVVEDFKSEATAKHRSFLRNCKHIKAEYGIDVVVVMRP